MCLWILIIAVFRSLPAELGICGLHFKSAAKSIFLWQAKRLKTRAGWGSKIDSIPVTLHSLYRTMRWGQLRAVLGL
jgi:hypothetical protein